MSFLDEIKEAIEGEVRSDPVSRNLYSVDASIYEVMPQAVVIPKNKTDILSTVKIAAKYNIPITARGAATGITGGCLGEGIILDLAQYCNQILEINWEEGYAVCEPGVVQDQLNDALREKGYRLGPDTSTGNRATLGGMLANNAAGSRSLKYGTMADHVIEVDMILSNGEEITIGPETSIHHPIIQQLWQLRDQNKEEIKKRFPKIPRRVSGYNLDALFEKNLVKLIVGSEGTLGVVTKIKVRIVPVPEKTTLCVLHFHTIAEGMDAIKKLLKFRPISLEMIDRKILEAGKCSPPIKDKLGWLLEDPEIVLVLELEGDCQEKLDALYEQPIGYAQIVLEDAEEQANVWAVRKAGLGLLLSKRSYSRAIAFIEDISIPPKHLPHFMEQFLSYLKSQGKEAGIYGHAGSGCLHIRPYINLRDPEECQQMQAILEEVTRLVKTFEGSLSGEHGDGRVRSWLNPRLYGKKIEHVFMRIKEIFDPKNLMNPGKIVNGEPFLKDLRLDPETPIRNPKTYLDFSKEGGFALSADLCNGNALCRKKEGTMCPSFQASGDEFHTTRARAQTLRGLIHGKLSEKEWTGEKLQEVLDLCLQCKACKSECPSQVDMAKMKIEVLHRHHQEHGVSIRDRVFGYIAKINQLSAPFAGLANRLNATPLMKKVFTRIGIAPQRELPKIAQQTFSKWFANHSPINGKPVILFNDTFNEFNCPDVGISAVQVLEKMGYRVILAPRQCCGRPLISKGILEPAKKGAEALVKTLLPFAEQQIPIIGLEPSCLLTITDDFQGLLGYDHEDLQKVIQACVTFDQFLAGHETLPFDQTGKRIQLHGHCHQKALEGTKTTVKVLEQIGEVSEIPSGCCGMAGSFGYEKEHYAFSMKIGELVLFPAVRESTGVLVANGFSCRCQIEHATGKKALHLAQALQSSLGEEEKTS